MSKLWERVKDRKPDMLQSMGVTESDVESVTESVTESVHCVTESHSD